MSEVLGLNDLKIKPAKLPKIKTAKTPKIKPISSVILKFDSEEKRVAIPASTQKEVYSRAKGKCESCGRKMKMTSDGGEFHHTRKPSVKSRPSSIQFLCAVCHRRYGHKKRTKLIKDAFGNVIEKKVTITRKKVGKHKP